MVQVKKTLKAIFSANSYWDIMEENLEFTKVSSVKRQIRTVRTELLLEPEMKLKYILSEIDFPFVRN